MIMTENTKKNSKRMIAGMMALLTVSGAVPANIGSFMMTSTAIVASAYTETPTTYTKDSDSIADGVILTKPGDKVDFSGTSEEMIFDSKTKWVDSESLGEEDANSTWSGVHSIYIDENGNFICNDFEDYSTLIPEDGKTFKISYDSANNVWHLAQVDAQQSPEEQKTTLTAENTTITMKNNSAEITSVVCGTTELTADDYDVSYTTKSGDPVEGVPTNVGDYTAVITGKGKYEGEVSKEFSIKYDINIAGVTFNENTADIAAVQYFESYLQAGVDYTLAYKDENFNHIDKPTSVGTYYAVFKGKGDFTGTKTVMFTIGKAAASMKLLDGCELIMGIPLSVSGKSPFFDREAKK